MKVFLALIISILISTSVLAQEVRLTSMLPATAESGSSFLVEILVNKSTLQSFARFEQTLPKGFSAKENATIGADFAFKDNKVEFTWLRLPYQKEFYFSYFVDVPDTLAGTFFIGGTFSYLVNSKRGSATLSPQKIVIDKASTTTAAGEKLTFIPEKVTPPEIFCQRTSQWNDSLPDILEVALTIEKNNYKDAASLIESTPYGFKVKILETGGAKVTEKGQQLVFSWDKMPKDSTIRVAYNLIAEAKTLVAPVLLSGELQTGNSQMQQSITVTEKQETPLFVNRVIRDQLMDLNLNTEQNKEMRASLEKKESKKTETNSNLEQTARELTAKSPAAKLLERITGQNENVSYSVQIAALNASLPARYFKDKNIDAKVKREKHNDMYKYTVGEFETYEEAKAYKEKIIKESEFKQAFITAYQKRDRIPVADALQKSKK